MEISGPFFKLFGQKPKKITIQVKNRWEFPYTLLPSQVIILF